MRRASIPFALAAIVITAIVGLTYGLRRENGGRRARELSHKLSVSEDGLANQGWKSYKDDPKTNRPVYRLDASSFRATNNPSTFELHGLTAKLFNKKDATYTYVKAGEAVFDERTGLFRSAGPVSIVMSVPVDKDAESKDELAKRVQVQTSGVTYETKSLKAFTNEPAAFVFPNGSGKSIGVEYDPNTKTLHMKSQVMLDRNGMHVETSDLIYRESEQKIYLSPWSKLQRQTMNIQAQKSVVTLIDGRVNQIDSEHPAGTDDRKGRHVEYSADEMTAYFDESGNMTEVAGRRNARVVSTQERSKTVITGNRADLHFAQEASAGKGEGYLSKVSAEGNAIAESSPIEQSGIVPSQTRILRSERIDLDMRPGGREVAEIHTPSKAQLEFKPNRPEQVHRVLDASKMRILYGQHNYIEKFIGWNVSTRTDKPALNQKQPPPPARTTSDEMTAKFAADSSDVEVIEQTGNFRYQEGTRKASASKAILEQKLNRITLIERAKVSDDTGSTSGDEIVMNQTTGDMDATGKVFSVRAPDKSQKPGTSMLDNRQPMQAKADKMRSRESNYKVAYEGHAVLWQNANRISADRIDIDRDEQTLHASGSVVSELVDSKKSAADSASPVYTTVKAPNLVYRDETREALYSGGVKLLRGSMVITSKELRAYLTPKNDESADSSLDRAFADGDFKVTQAIAANHTRTGWADRGEYYTKEDKVVLKGGAPQIVDSLRGVTKGREITYFSGEDRLLVEGEVKMPALTKMTKK